jgi:polyhydroxyalkanoate synthesis regulator phasin/uncharacterized coiled-coil protein SlyX
MNTVTVTLTMLVKQFAEGVKRVHEMRLHLGDIVNRMRQVEPSDSRIVAALQEAIPDAKIMLGYAITKRTLDSLASAASTFSAGGGWISPDGLHHITRADIEPLGLTPDQLGKLADLVSTGKVKGKRVLRETARYAKDPKGDQGKNAKARLLNMLSKGDDTAPSEQSLAQLTDELTRMLEQRDKLDERITRKRAQIKARSEAIAAASVPAPAPKPARPTKRDRSRSQSTLSA